MPYDLIEAIKKRHSFRDFSAKPINIEQLSSILYYSMGIRGKFSDGKLMLRMYPSAGAKYPLEAYILVRFGKKYFRRSLPLSS